MFLPSPSFAFRIGFFVCAFFVTTLGTTLAEKEKTGTEIAQPIADRLEEKWRSDAKVIRTSKHVIFYKGTDKGKFTEDRKY